MKYDSAKSAYTRVLERDPNHAKVLQQLGWLHHQQSTSFSSQEQAIEYLEKSVASGMSPIFFFFEIVTTNLLTIARPK